LSNDASEEELRLYGLWNKHRSHANRLVVNESSLYELEKQLSQYPTLFLN
jgi:hypothetical protein